MSRVIVSMDEDTVHALEASGYILYVFKAVRCFNKAARPLVWFRLGRYGTTVEIEWSEKYQAYISTEPIRAGRRIVPSNSRDILVNQTLEVYSPGRTAVMATGLPAQIRIQNNSGERFTTGISQRHAENMSSLCAVPLFSIEEQLIAPLPEVLLMFWTEDLPPGTVIGNAAGLPEPLAHSRFARSSLGGIWISLKDAPGDQRQVTFNIDQNWSAGNAPWARRISASTNLVPWLVQQSTPSLARPSPPAAPGAPNLILS